MRGKQRAWAAGFAAGAGLLACTAQSAAASDEAACPGCGAVGISVISIAGTAIATEAYVALIQKGKPPREPLFEAILADAGKGVTWQAPAGAYGVLCSALGFGDAFVQPVRLEGGPVHAGCVRAHTARARHGQGAVRGDRQTHRRRNGRARATLQGGSPKPPHPGRPAAPVAEQVAVTARDGTYSLSAMPGFRNTYVFQADGAGFKVLENVVVPKGGLTLPDVVLPPGGALEVDASVLPGGDPTSFVVALGPYTFRGWEQREEPHVLRRHLEPSGRARFESVPVGVWLVHLELPGGGRIYAGTVEITAGGFATMTVALADTKVEGVLRGLDPAEAESTKLSFESWVSEKSVEARVFVDTSGPKPIVRYAARFVAAGTYWPTLSGPDGQGAQYLGPVTVKSETGTRTLDLDVPASYRISGTVVNVTGDPVQDASVTLGHGVWPLCTTRTDRDGRWACGHVHAGDVVLLAHKVGVGVSELTKAKAGEGGAPVLLTLKPGRSLMGTISVPERSEQEMTHVAFVLDGFSAGRNPGAEPRKRWALRAHDAAVGTGANPRAAGQEPQPLVCTPAGWG